MERPVLRLAWYGMTTVALGRFASWCAGRRPEQAPLNVEQSHRCNDFIPPCHTDSLRSGLQ